MPKAKKNADFQKTKLKLGKKQQANNATNTSFKARTIALPQQSINVDKSGRLTNSRNLGVTDLAQQLRHYGAGVRKEAVVGIREILQIHPVLIETAVGQLIPDLCRVIGDDDATVRRNVYSLFSWYLPQIPSALLAPYVNALLLFTASALSHIYPEVRQDAVKVLDLLLQLAPTVATAGWENAIHKFSRPGSSSASTSSNGPSASTSSAAGGDQLSHGERFMSCYLNLLGITHRSASSSAGAASTTATDLSPTAKLLILRSLRSFLTAATGSGSVQSVDTTGDKGKASGETTSGRQAAQPRLDCPTWFFRPCFKGEADFEYFQGIMRPDLRKRNARAFTQRTSAEGTQTTKSKKRKVAKAPELTESEFHSADFGSASLVDIQGTLGQSWGAGDLHAVLLSAASQDSLATDPASSSRGSTSNVPSSPASAALHLFSLLQPVMVASFLDSAPSAFRPDMDLHSAPAGRGSQNAGLSAPAEIISHLLGLCLTLWRSAISSSSTGFGSTPIRATKAQRSELGNILGHMAAYFPFSQQGAASDSTALSQKAKAVTIEMDLGFSELTALLALSMGPSALSTEGRAKGKSRINLSVQLELVSRYISELLSSSADVTGTVSLAGNAVAALDQETYATLLPTVWLLLNTAESDLLESVLAHFERCSSISKVKSLAFEFIARIWVLQTFDTDASFRITPKSTTRGRLSKWFETLPRVLWEMSAPADSGNGPRKILEFLRHLLSSPKVLPISLPEKETLREKLVPFFWFQHPAKDVSVAGPFAKLAREERLEAIALVEWLGCGSMPAYRDEGAPGTKLSSAVNRAIA